MNPVYSSDDIAKIRTRYRSRDLVIFDPCEVVFQAQVSSAPSAADGTYLQISYDTVSTGAYTDIKTGMMLLISSTSDHTDFLYEMRVAATPTSSILYVNESAYVLAENQYITVIDTYKPLPRVRKGSMVDGRLAYQGLPATITNLPSAMVVLSSGTGQFVLNPSIQTFDGATVSSTLYDIPGATYDVGGTGTLASTVTMPADSHTWGRLTYTLISGVTGYMVFQLIVQDPANPTLATQRVDQLRLNRRWQGDHANCRASNGVTVSQVMNGTRAVIVSQRRYAGGTLDGGMENVSFVGYLSKEDNSTQSVSDKTVMFDLVGIWERAGQLPMNPIAIRDVASPTKWDEINLPTSQKVIAHILARYSTILNLCSLNLDVTDNTWFGGDMDMPATSLGDAIEQVLSEINAHIIQNPSGELYLRRDLRFEDDTTRDDADVVWTLTNADLINLDVSVQHDEQTGRIIVGFRGYFTNRSPSKGGKAVAPVVTLGTSPKTQTRGNQLLRANQTDAQLKAEAEQRAGDLLASENPPFEMNAGLKPYLSWLNTSCAQWITLNLLSSIITRGRAFNQRTLLESIELSYDNVAGSHDLTVSLLPETRGGGALVVAGLTPNVSSLSMFVLPPLSAYGGNYGGPSTLNATDDASPRFNRKNMGGMGVPIPPDQSYDEGQYAPEAGKKKFAISFANSADVAAGFTSVNGADYAVTLAGSAKISDDAWSQTFNMTTGLNGFVFETDDNGANIGSFSAGVGIVAADNEIGGTFARSVSLILSESIPSLTGVSTTFGIAKGAFSDPGQPAWAFVIDGVLVHSLLPGSVPDGTNVVISHSLNSAVATSMRIGIAANFQVTPVFTGSVTLKSITLSGTGTNPFTGDPGVELYADAFYQWQIGTEEEEGEEINVSYLGTSRGFQINSAAIAVPPEYNPSHEYTVEWEGDGSIPDVIWADDDHTDNENKLLFVGFEGPGVDD